MLGVTELPCPWSGLSVLIWRFGLGFAVPAESVTRRLQVSVPLAGGAGVDWTRMYFVPLPAVTERLGAYVITRESCEQSTNSSPSPGCEPPQVAMVAAMAISAMRKNVGSSRCISLLLQLLGEPHVNQPRSSARSCAVGRGSPSGGIRQE